MTIFLNILTWFVLILIVGPVVFFFVGLCLLTSPKDLPRNPTEPESDTEAMQQQEQGDPDVDANDL